jgi:hypothetical protein
VNANVFAGGLNRKSAVLAAVLLVVLIVVSLFLVIKPPAQIPKKPFYVGVEFGFGTQFSQVKATVDEVKNYTNLFVLGALSITFNLTALNESCNYIYAAGLSFIVLFTSYYMYNLNGWSSSYTIFNWTRTAQQIYGDKFLGIYRFDEPGGNQLDKGKSQIINDTSLSFAQVNEGYVGNLSSIVQYYAHLGNVTPEPAVKIFTSDYGLYWYDYQAEYTTVFAELLPNSDNPLTIALDRGAAQSFNRTWGVIVTRNSGLPQPLSETQLLSDLYMSYNAGATYAVIFPFNLTGYSYWTLPPQYFAALQSFWSDLHTNPHLFHSSPAEVAYVAPNDFGFGFRSATDTIWGLFPASSYSYTAKIWNASQNLLSKYGDDLNIIFDNQTVIQPILKEYSKVYYYNQTLT